MFVAGAAFAIKQCKINKSYPWKKFDHEHEYKVQKQNSPPNALYRIPLIRIPLRPVIKTGKNQ